jgi:hypothetical protein
VRAVHRADRFKTSSVVETVALIVPGVSTATPTRSELTSA